jgi:3-methyladenine DNA glycosylase AlkC
MSKPTKVDQVKDLVKQGVARPESVFSEIKKMAQDEDWRVREVAATVLVGICKKQLEKVLKEMEKWASNRDENIRRTSIESLRGVARVNPKSVLSMLEELKEDASTYVKKSVANIMRDASKGDPKIILKLAFRWAKSKNEHTLWIVKNGIKKLPTELQERVRSK